MLRADWDGEDALQTVLATAWRCLPQFEYRGPRSVQRWLVALTDGAIQDRVKYLAAKGRGAVRHVESVAGPTGRPPEVWDPATSISRAAGRREDTDRVSAALAQLPQTDRDVVERHLLEAQSLGEISAELGHSKTVVWRALHRGLAALRDDLGHVS